MGIWTHPVVSQQVFLFFRLNWAVLLTSTSTFNVQMGFIRAACSRSHKLPRDWQSGVIFRYHHLEIKLNTYCWPNLLLIFIKYSYISFLHWKIKQRNDQFNSLSLKDIYCAKTVPMGRTGGNEWKSHRRPGTAAAVTKHPSRKCSIFLDYLQ